MNKPVDEGLLAEIVQVILRDLPETQAIYLYGSYARDEQRPDSDIDLAVLLPHETAKRIGSLALSKTQSAVASVVRRDVDLINLRRVSPVLQAEVVGTGRMLCVCDADASDEFEMAAFSALQDLNRMQADLLREFKRTKRAYTV